MLNSKKYNSHGFTLLEILLVVGIISILAGIVIVAINPSKQLATVRNTERRSDIKQIDSALAQYYIDHNSYPTSVTSTLTEICDTGSLSTTTGSDIDCTDLIDLTPLVPLYVTAIPTDPKASTTQGAGYSVIKTSNKIGLSAPAELDQTITIGTVIVGTEEGDACGVSGDATDPDCWSATSISAGAWGSMEVPTSVQNLTDGKTNTNTLVTNYSNGLPWNAGGNYPAAQFCYGLDENGHTDWYLPAKEQLLEGVTTALSNFNSNPNWGGFASGVTYWSSTEDSGDVSNSAFVANYYSEINFAYDLSVNKNSGNYITHCLR